VVRRRERFVDRPGNGTLTLSFGAQNILNTYPHENPGAVDGVGNRYGQFGPFGFNGGYYYTRIGFGWGS